MLTGLAIGGPLGCPSPWASLQCALVYSRSVTPIQETHRTRDVRSEQTSKRAYFGTALDIGSKLGSRNWARAWVQSEMGHLASTESTVSCKSGLWTIEMAYGWRRLSHGTASCRRNAHRRGSGCRYLWQGEYSRATYVGHRREHTKFAIGGYLDGVGMPMGRGQGDPAIGSPPFVERSVGSLEHNFVVTPFTPALDSSVHFHPRIRARR